jgi:anti-sigma28 factor (negative regulator of flagellin synthesis)
MKINPSLVNQIYKKNQIINQESSTKQHGENLSSATKVDTITISAEGSKQNSLNKLAQRIATEVDAPLDPNRLAQLRSTVTQKQYHVDTESLTAAILGRHNIDQNKN